MLKKNILIISVCYTIALLIFSLIALDLGGLKSIVPSNGDKIFHFTAYSILAWLWYNTFVYKYNFVKKRALFKVIIYTILFGIIVEVLQNSLTSTRFFDVEDIIANTLGIVSASILIWFNIKRDVKK